MEKNRKFSKEINEPSKIDEAAENFDLKQGEKRLKRFTELIKEKKSFGFLLDLKKEFPECEQYIVGGIVRDKILGRGPHPYDADFVVRKVPVEELKKFLSQRGKTELFETTTGAFRFTPKDSNLKEPLNVSLPRTEISYGPSCQDFAFEYDSNFSIEEDLSRRDFTINAMAWDMEEKKIIDPYGGVADLEAKLIRTVENPEKTFAEDYSRILRALRFACLLDFKIEEKTWLAIKEYGPKILKERLFGEKKRPIVPWDTIGKEFMKTLKANPEKTLDLYNESGILNLILPEVKVLEKVSKPFGLELEENAFIHTKSVLHHTPKNASFELKLAALLHNIGLGKTELQNFEKQKIEMAEKICDRFRFPKKTREQVCWLIKHRHLFLTGDIFQMKPRSIKKYFIDNPVLGNELLEFFKIETRTSFLDIEQKEYFDKINKIEKNIRTMYQVFEETKMKSFACIISGDDIIHRFEFKPKTKKRIDLEKTGKYLEEAERFILKYVIKESKVPEKEKVLKHLEDWGNQLILKINLNI